MLRLQACNTTPASVGFFYAVLDGEAVFYKRAVESVSLLENHTPITMHSAVHIKPPPLWPACASPSYCFQSLVFLENRRVPEMWVSESDSNSTKKTLIPFFLQSRKHGHLCPLIPVADLNGLGHRVCRTSGQVFPSKTTWTCIA